MKLKLIHYLVPEIHQVGLQQRKTYDFIGLTRPFDILETNSPPKLFDEGSANDLTSHTEITTSDPLTQLCLWHYLSWFSTLTTFLKQNSSIVAINRQKWYWLFPLWNISKYGLSQSVSSLAKGILMNLDSTIKLIIHVCCLDFQ